jgi:hypothetical protein
LNKVEEHKLIIQISMHQPARMLHESDSGGSAIHSMFDVGRSMFDVKKWWGFIYGHL